MKNGIEKAKNEDRIYMEHVMECAQAWGVKADVAQTREDMEIAIRMKTQYQSKWYELYDKWV